MTTEIINRYEDIDLSRWDKFVKNHVNGNFFQTPELYQFYSKVENYYPLIIVAETGGSYVGSLLGVIIRVKSIKGYFSSRAIIIGGPIVDDEHDDAFRLLILKMKALCSGKAIYTEMRNLFMVSNERERILRNSGFSFLPYQNYIVPLKRMERGEIKISNSRARQIKASLKNGAQITEPRGVDEVAGLYQILSELYKTRVKKPLPGFDFFRLFYETPNLGKIFLVKRNEQIIGGIVAPVFNNKIIYEWYIAGRSEVGSGVNPGVLATWAPIEYGINNGLDYFDFMGAGRKDRDYGVREFKSKFGVETVEFGRFRRINNISLWIIARAGLKVLSYINRI